MFDSIKLYAGLALGFIVLVFGFLFNRRGVKIEEQEEIIEAKDMQLDTQEQVYESRISKTKLEGDMTTSDEKNSKENAESKSDMVNTITNTPDGVPYKVEL